MPHLLCFFVLWSQALWAALPIMQGPSSADQVTVAVLTTKDKPVTLAITAPGQKTPVAADFASQYTIPGSSRMMQHAVFRGLKERIVYDLIASGSKGERLDTRQLTTLAATNKLRLAVASCMDDSMPERNTVWGELASHRPDVVFLLGDNVYADRSDGKAKPIVAAAQLWERYGETRERLQLFFLPRLIPIVATYDDHDYGADDGDRNFTFRHDAIQTFKAFFPQHSLADTYEAGPGVASSLRVGSQKFVLLDGRTFRFGTKQDKNQEQFGSEQLSWLVAKMHDGAPTWIMNGGQFYGAYHEFESLEGSQPAAFERWRDAMRRTSNPFVLVSGDRHLFEMMAIEPAEFGFPTFEITSSAIHAKVFPSSWDKYPNRRQLAGVAGEHNYAVIDSELGSSWQIVVRAYGPGHKVLASKSVAVPLVRTASSPTH